MVHYVAELLISIHLVSTLSHFPQLFCTCLSFQFFLADFLSWFHFSKYIRTYRKYHLHTSISKFSYLPVYALFLFTSFGGHGDIFPSLIECTEFCPLSLSHSYISSNLSSLYLWSPLCCESFLGVHRHAFVSFSLKVPFPDSISHCNYHFTSLFSSTEDLINDCMYLFLLVLLLLFSLESSSVKFLHCPYQTKDQCR